MKSPRWLSEDEQRMWRLTRHFYQLLDLATERQLQQIASMSGADYSVLVCLTEGPEEGLRAREIGTTLGWDRSRVSHQVRRMVERGLVSKEACLEDGRGTVVRITDHGRKEIEAAAPQHVEKVRELYVDLLSREELETLTRIFERSIARIDEVDGISLPR